MQMYIFEPMFISAYVDIHTYIHTYIHAYIHTYIHTYIHRPEAAALQASYYMSNPTIQLLERSWNLADGKVLRKMGGLAAYSLYGLRYVRMYHIMYVCMDGWMDGWMYLCAGIK